jgi:hypothetical protein
MDDLEIVAHASTILSCKQWLRILIDSAQAQISAFAAQALKIS